MFDGNKVQQEILKDAFRNNNFSWHYRDIENNKIAVTNGYAMAIIPDYMMYLDKEKILWKSRLDNLSAIKSLLNDDEMPDVDMVGILEERVSGKKVRLCIFNNRANGERIYVNKRYVDWFANGRSITFKGCKKGKRIFVYDAQELVGVIMIINRKE